MKPMTDLEVLDRALARSGLSPFDATRLRRVLPEIGLAETLATIGTLQRDASATRREFEAALVLAPLGERDKQQLRDSVDHIGVPAALKIINGTLGRVHSIDNRRRGR